MCQNWPCPCVRAKSLRRNSVFLEVFDVYSGPFERYKESISDLKFGVFVFIHPKVVDGKTNGTPILCILIPMSRKSLFRSAESIAVHNAKHYF